MTETTKTAGAKRAVSKSAAGEGKSKAETKREAIRNKVAASKSDLARRAPTDAEPPEGLRALAADYPFALLIGGAALGVLAAAVLPRGLRLAVGSKLSRRAVAAAGIAAELGLAYGKRALEAAAESAGEAREKAGDLGAAATAGVAGYSQKAARTAREAGITIGRQAIKLRSHLRH